MNTDLRRHEKRIAAIKRELQKIGDMRPGSLSRQFNTCGNPKCRCKDPEDPRRHGPYFQLKYTRKGKSRTEFVRREQVEDIRRQLSNYARFRDLTEEWVDLSIEIARLRKKDAAETPGSE